MKVTQDLKKEIFLLSYLKDKDKDSYSVWQRLWMHYQRC